MLVLIVAVVAIGAIFVIGALVGMSVAQNAAGDRARDRQRDLRLAGVGAGPFATDGMADMADMAGAAGTRGVRTRDVVFHATRRAA
jgi:hypothetical protein